ncbi:MAG: thermonuclease family protein [Patescibacteria group bacterium]
MSRKRSVLFFSALCVLVAQLFLAEGRPVPFDADISPLVASVGETAATSSKQTGLSLVTKVVDGDTVKLLLGTTTETVRLIGIDTPETVDPRKPVQCFGKEASEKMKQLVLGKYVRVEVDETQGERDKYGRMLVYLFLADGIFVNKLMVEEGYAHEYTYRLPYRYQAEFKKAEEDAREAKRGLWNPDVCSE